ncbi:MAG: Ribonuclease P protein component [Parcubacteria group bacterium GW2011_GWA2_51_10]|nr:MAG: Ribonuclease P protein component [Parcubacteria group bacterium GW2011_GWA2_51_10]
MAHSYSLSRGDFKEIEKARFRREHGKLFTLTHGALSAAVSGVKFSCVVSKKVSSKAVERNLIKRRCRAAVLERVPRARGSTALVFYAKKTALGATYAEIKHDIADLLEKSREN